MRPPQHRAVRLQDLVAPRRRRRPVRQAPKISRNIAVAIRVVVARKHRVLRRSRPVRPRIVVVFEIRQRRVANVVVHVRWASRRRRIRHREQLHQRLHRCIETSRGNGVVHERLAVRSGESRRARGRIVNSRILHAHRRRGRRAEVSDPLIRQRHRARPQHTLLDARSFVVEKEEETILDHRTAHIPAELVLVVLWLGQPVPVRKEIVRVKIIVADIFISQPMELVRSTLRVH